MHSGTKGVPVGSSILLRTYVVMSSKENSIGAISGVKKGKINNFKRGLFWAGWDTQGQTHSSLFKKSSLQSPSISGAEQSGISLIPDIYSPFVGSWPLSQWFILENEHTHTWLIIFGKYLNNLGVRQERAKVVKSMLAGTENGTGGWAPGLMIRELGESLSLSGPQLSNQKT